MSCSSWKSFEAREIGTSGPDSHSKPQSIEVVSSFSTHRKLLSCCLKSFNKKFRFGIFCVPIFWGSDRGGEFNNWYETLSSKISFWRSVSSCHKSLQLECRFWSRKMIEGVFLKFFQTHFSTLQIYRFALNGAENFEKHALIFSICRDLHSNLNGFVVVFILYASFPWQVYGFRIDLETWIESASRYLQIFFSRKNGAKHFLRRFRFGGSQRPFRHFQRKK